MRRSCGRTFGEVLGRVFVDGTGRGFWGAPSGGNTHNPFSIPVCERQMNLDGNNCWHIEKVLKTIEVRCEMLCGNHVETILEELVLHLFLPISAHEAFQK